MPLYEFYCEPCHTVFTFRSPRIDTATLPPCPACGAKLRREVSACAHIVRGKNEAGAAGEGDAASRMDQVMAQMGDRLQALDDGDADPRDAVRAMRELAAAGGLTFNRDVQEAMARVEAGEDPEKIDETFSEVFDTENPFADGDDAPGSKAPGWWRRLRGPRRDPVWHDLVTDPES
jgi:putative FmdB family regulatory protein